ncbi:MAG: PGF-pre-PGF domain-containing protein, partial [Nanoarchaeota archaeon]|nr:PGF-pre-PGF domain-containing protein [Nanoarchaeota archaeon]
FLVLILIVSMAYFAVGLTQVAVHSFFNGTVQGYNNTIVSGNIILNVTTDDENTTNVTFYWIRDTNGNGVGDDWVYNTTLLNGTLSTTTFNITLDTVTNLPDGVYDLNVTAWNMSGDSNIAEMVSNLSLMNITVDNTAPVVTFTIPENNTNQSTGVQEFNTSIVDNITISLVLFEFSNASGNPINRTAVNSSGNWSVGENMTGLIEGYQSVMVFANDTRNNSGWSTVLYFTVDRTAPTVILVNSSFNTTDTTPAVTFNYTDALFVAASCVLYFNGTAYNTSTVNNGTNTALIVNNTLSDGSYSVNVNCTDGSNNQGNSSLITINIDTGSPAVTTFNSPTNGSYNKIDFVLNVTVTGSPLTVQYRIENGSNTSQVVVNYTNMSNPSGNLWNATINVSAIADWNYTVRINATDALGNSNITETLLFSIDDTNPSVSSFSCSNVNEGASQSCTCSGADNSQSFGGSVSTSVSSVSTSTAGTKTVTCTATDSAGNTATSDTTYIVSAVEVSGGGSGGSGGGLSSSAPASFSQMTWASINAGETGTVEVENGEIGVTEVSFAVEDTTYGAWVKVERKTSLPSNVGAFSGTTYKNIQITERNVEKVMKDKATIKFKVEKTWLTENKVGKNFVTLFRYVDDKWTELPTTLGADDGTYVHYTATSPGFSYFVIGVKEEVVAEAAVAAEEEATAEAAEPEVAETTAGTGELAAEAAGLGWLWITLLVIVVLAGIGYYIYAKKK